MNFWKDFRSDRDRQADLYRSDGPRERASLTQRAYHRYFEGYTEVSELNERGKTVTRRVYTGKYYEPDLADYRRLSLRLVYVLCFVGGTALFLYCATRPLVCNTAPYVGLFQAAAIVLLLWCLSVLIFYLPATGKLTIGQYKSQHRALVNSSRAVAFSMWAAAAAALLCTALHMGDRPLLNLLCAAGFGASGLLLFVIFLFESHLRYTVTDSPDTAPEDGYEIE